MAKKRGYEGVLGYRVGGSGSFTKINSTVNVSSDSEAGEIDITTRDNNGWEAFLAGLKTMQFEFDVMWDASDASTQALRGAYENGTEIELAALDGPLASGNGWRMPCQVFKFGRGEQLREAMRVPVVAKYTGSGSVPTYVSGGVTVASS